MRGYVQQALSRFGETRVENRRIRRNHDLRGVQAPRVSAPGRPDVDGAARRQSRDEHRGRKRAEQVAEDGSGHERHTRTSLRGHLDRDVADREQQTSRDPIGRCCA